jgi:hypothetical protein
MSESKGKTSPQKFCHDCGSILVQGAAFCQKCGIEVSPSTKQVKPELPKPIEEIKRKLPPLNAKGLASKIRQKFQSNRRSFFLSLAAIGVVGVSIVALAATPGALSPLTADQIPKFATVVGEEKISEIASSLCPSLKASIPTDATIAEFDDRMAQIKDVGGNARNMLAFSDRTSWMVNSSESKSLGNSVSKISQSGLSKLLSDPPIWGIDDSNRDLVVKTWEKDFEKSIISSCGLEAEISAAEKATQRYDSAVNNAVSLAESAPWYPRGFSTLYSDEDELAYKFTDKPKDCYSCYEWTATIVSQNGCSSTYAEGNMTSSSGGSVVDWSNDTTGALSPGQTADISFQSYVDGYGTLWFEFTELNCY